MKVLVIWLASAKPGSASGVAVAATLVASAAMRNGKVVSFDFKGATDAARPRVVCPPDPSFAPDAFARH